MGLASEVWHQPVAALNHSPGEEGKPGFIRVIEDPLADGGNEERRRDGHREEQILPFALTHVGRSDTIPLMPSVCIGQGIANPRARHYNLNGRDVMDEV